MYVTEIGARYLETNDARVMVHIWKWAGAKPWQAFIVSREQADKGQGYLIECSSGGNGYKTLNGAINGARRTLKKYGWTLNEEDAKEIEAGRPTQPEGIA